MKTIALYGNTSFMVAIAILVFLLIGMYVCVNVCALSFQQCLEHEFGCESNMITCVCMFFCVWFLDAFREVAKYSVTEKVDLTNNPTAIEHIHMKLFRAQRNEYIAGFALLLCL